MTTVTSPAGSGPLPATSAGYGTSTTGSASLAGGAGAAVVDGGGAVGSEGWAGRTDPAVRAYGYGPGPEAYRPAYPQAEPGRFTAFLLRMWDRSPAWLAPAAILACFAGAAGYVLVTDPTDDGADAASTCLVKLTTGFDCPGCGGTRAFYYLLKGNIPAAARHHLLFVFAVPFLAYMYVSWASQRVFRRSLPELRLPPLAMGLFLAAWGVFSVLRNLPWAPFTWLYV